MKLTKKEEKRICKECIREDAVCWFKNCKLGELQLSEENKGC